MLTYFIVERSFLIVDQRRALTALGLFGNAGGYLGMFLGCALIQLPDFLYALYRWIYGRRYGTNDGTKLA